MLKKLYLLFSFGVLTLSACGTLEIRVAQGATPASTVVSQTPASAPTTIFETPTSAEATLTPTLTPVVSGPSPTPLPPPGQSGQPYRIRFAPNATWIDVVDHLDSGVSKVYVLSAMQGQVTSVSISPGQSDPWYFPIEIRGQDGVVICPLSDGRECQFWRGVLPATQEYFITVKALAAGNFILRVAINPPGLARQYFEFADSQRAIALSYSDEFSPTTRLPTGDRYKGVPLLILNLITPDFYTSTNLSEAAFMLNVVQDPQAKSTCMEDELNSEKRTVNGYTYVYSEMTGVAAGTFGEQLIYRTLHRDTCYEIVFHMNSFSIGNLSPELASGYQEFDRMRLLHKFEEILSTFTLQ